MKHVFDDKRAILTGGTSDEGVLIGKQLLEQGVTCLALLDTADLNDVCGQLRRAFPERRIVFVPVSDLSRRHNVREAFNSVFKEFGVAMLDVLLIGCGRGIVSDVEKNITPATNEEFKANLDVAEAEASALIASINVIYETIDAMTVTRGGRGGVVAHLSQPPTSSSQSPNHQTNTALSTDQAIVGLMRSLSHEHFHKKHGISFVTFCRRPPDQLTTTCTNEPNHVIGSKNANISITDSRRYELCINTLISTLTSAENGSMRRIIKSVDQLNEIPKPESLHSRTK